MSKSDPQSIPNIVPKFNADVSKAYIVASILLGHILVASTNTGMLLNFPIKSTKIASPKQKNLSLIPHSTFFLVTNMSSDS